MLACVFRTWHGEPALQRAEERGNAEAGELALRLDKLNEEMNLRKSQKTQLVQQIAVELRRRLRELTGSGVTPSSSGR